MLNAIFYGMNLLGEKKGLAKLCELLELIKVNGNQVFDKTKVVNAEIIIEPSLSDFGYPDVVIILNYSGKKCVLFFEAKVKTWHKDQWNSKISNFKTQLRRFSDSVGKRISKDGKKRKIGTNGVVLQFYKMIKDADEFYFIALLPKKVSLKHNWGLLLWEDIEKKLVIPGLKENFDFNRTVTDARSQIY